jgi:hypothetical protein
MLADVVSVWQCPRDCRNALDGQAACVAQVQLMQAVIVVWCTARGREGEACSAPGAEG